MKVLARSQQYEIWKTLKRQVTIRSQKNANKGNFGVNSDVKKGQGQNIRKKKKLKPDSKSRLKNITRKEKSHVFFKSVAKII